MNNTQELEIPKMRHINCQNYRCTVCMDDAMKLQEYLEKKTGDYKSDLLGKYRYWLDQNKIFAETEWGWFSINVFKPENIKAFIKHHKRQIR